MSRLVTRASGCAGLASIVSVFRQSQSALASLLMLSTVPSENSAFVTDPSTMCFNEYAGLEALNLSFYYDVANLRTTSRPVLDGVSFFVPRGAKVGCVYHKFSCANNGKDALNTPDTISIP
eukprot:727640-Pyramimonas_sp.AAC.1